MSLALRSLGGEVTSFPKINGKGTVSKCSLSKGILHSKPDKSYNVVYEKIVIQTVHRRLDFLTASTSFVTMAWKTGSNYGLSNWNFFSHFSKNFGEALI